MSKKSLIKQYNILTAKINSIEAKEMEFCYISANGGDVNEQWSNLQVVKFDLATKRSAVVQQLNKPSIFSFGRRAK